MGPLGSGPTAINDEPFRLGMGMGMGNGTGMGAEVVGARWMSDAGAVLERVAAFLWVVGFMGRGLAFLHWPGRGGMLGLWTCRKGWL